MNIKTTIETTIKTRCLASATAIATVMAAAALLSGHACASPSAAHVFPVSRTVHAGSGQVPNFTGPPWT
jgi:hypothetical protein